jgi:hypothetical protein
MLTSVTDTGASLGLVLDYLKFLQSTLSSAKLLAISVSSNIKLDDVEVLKSSNRYAISSQKMLVIFEAIGLYEILVLGINSSLLASADKSITFQLAQQQRLRIIIQVLSNEIFGQIAKLTTPNDMRIYLRMSHKCNSTHFYIIALQSFLRIK